MRTLGFGLVLLGAAIGLAFGCGVSEGGAGANGGSAGSGAATAGSSNGSAGTAGKAGANATAGAASGGTSGGGNGGSGNGAGVSGNAATTGGQPDAQAGAGNEAGSAALVDCDPKKILCKRLAPQCTAGEVPSVEGSCYGDCVKIDRCRCAAAAECPEPDQYTCWAKQHCGPFVR